MLDFSNAEDLKAGGKLIDEGTIVDCAIIVDDERTSNAGNKCYNVTFEVAAGEFAGSKFFDDIILTGDAAEWGRGKVKHILEFSDKAHQNPEAYKIQSMKVLNGKRALVQVKVDTHKTKDGKWIYINKVKTYATPREDSSTYKLYEAWAKGEQPWQTDRLPPLPVGQTHNGSDSFGHASQEIPL